MYTFIIKYNDKHVQKYLRKAERNLESGSRQTIGRIGNLAYAKALTHAPFKTGALRKSIILQRLYNTNQQKSVVITTRGDSDSRRKRSFSATEWKTFVNYLHNSDKGYLNQLNWHGKIYDFLTNDLVYRDVEDKFATSVITLINQSFK